MDIQRGFRDKLDNIISASSLFEVEITFTGAGVYDSSCFGVDANDKLSDDRYMVFFNQTSSPNKEVVLTQGANTSKYAVNLAALPQTIQKLVFTGSIDGDGTMGQINSCVVSIKQNGQEKLALRLSGKDFQSEKAIIAIEIYKKDVWRVAAIASGFNGGLADLLKNYGGEEAAANTPSPKPDKVSLEKRLEKEAPQLVSLAKPLKVSLEKHKLTDVVAQVALLIDISGSMTSTFKRGTVQRVIDKIVPLALQFDDNGEFELWYFGAGCKRMPPVTANNYSKAADDWKSIMDRLGGGTNLAPALDDVIDEYRGGKLPAYVLCITDGATSSEGKVKKLIAKASEYPIFWQFIGIGGSGYGVLEDLDTMAGRKVDNANFFALDDIDRIDNTELYSRMLAEFPIWLKEAKRLGMI
ncbi:tellurium resistance protein [Synergistales bacterium]|nr:tellurium resistance protein [Synergistales bacterium]